MATVATPVADVCRAAKRAARALASLDTVVKDAALESIADALESRARGDPRGERARHAGRPRQRHRRRAAGSIAPGRAADRPDRAGGQADRRAPRPRRRGYRGAAPAERARRAQGARPARCRRGDLRGAPERDDRRRCAVPEVGQRDRPARLLIGPALQRRARADRRGGRRRPRAPARLRQPRWPEAGARSWPSWPGRRTAST